VNRGMAKEEEDEEDEAQSPKLPGERIWDQERDNREDKRG
jgi:hypothetical protein